jgi:hypothetical protein
MTTTRSYSDHRPYAPPPDRITDLAGPAGSTVILPVTIDWGPRRVYNLELEADRRILCERVLREASSTAEICQWVNGAALLLVWSALRLPHRLRRAWEDAFPQLCTPAA